MQAPAALRLCCRVGATATFALSLTGCVSNVGPAVDQFGTAAVATGKAEGAMFDAIEQRQADKRALCTLTSRSIDFDPQSRDGEPLTDCPFSASTTPVIGPDVRKGINAVLEAIQTYGVAMQSFVADPAAATFSSNVGALGQSLANFDTAVLAPLAPRSLPKAGQINAVASSIKAVGGLLIDFAKSRDVKVAAQNMRGPLHDIQTGLVTINSIWTEQNPVQDARAIRNYVILLWPKASLTDRLRLLDFNRAASQAIVADDANKALAELVEANEKVAAAGPDGSVAEVKRALDAAIAALHAYSALTGK